MVIDLELKLEGKLPVTRTELLELVSSWGRKDWILTNDNINIDQCKPKECYNLSNLDVSQIKNFNNIFDSSPYNGDLSKWDISSCETMRFMFWGSKFNNDSISNWNISNCKDLYGAFGESIFNGDLSKWDVSNVVLMTRLFEKSKFNNDSISNWNISKTLFMENMFEDSKFTKDISKWEFNKDVYCYNIFACSEFNKKYNSGNQIPFDTNKFLKWFKENKKNISNLNVTKEEINDIDDYLSNFEIKEIQ